MMAKPTATASMIRLSSLLLAQLCWLVVGWSLSLPPSSPRDYHLDRRTWFSQVALGGATMCSFVPPSDGAAANDELPMAIRSYTKLAPLGTASSKSSSTTGENKAINLSLNDVAARLSRDLTDGATGMGSYIVTGDLSSDIFMESCSFVDPTNRVDSLQKYLQAVAILFDADSSRVDVLVAPTVNPVDDTIRATYRCRGTLKLPWRPIVSAFESVIVWTVDRKTGLIVKQEQTWSKSAADALRESFTPSIFAPPEPSTRLKRSDEPIIVTELFEMVNGRRDADYSDAERRSIEAWIDQISALNIPFQAPLLPGMWRLVYLRPGTDGSGIDRRIPFPEFSFNDSFQIFNSKSVVNAAAATATTNDASRTVRNVGQLWGPNLYVAVSGDLTDVDVAMKSKTRQRLQANIRGGELCFGSDTTCVELPISGVGIFESVYLGDRLRIGQNVNGGGALVVQVRMD